MEYRAHEVKAGLLVIAAGLVVVIFLVAMAGVKWRQQEKVYTARFNYLGGIERGSLVRYGGFLVGAVTDIYIAPDDKTKIEIKIAVDERAPVRVDSEAFISAINLMGDFYIELTTGSPDAELLLSGSMLQSRDVPSFSRLSEPLAKLSDQVEILLVRLNDMLKDENRAHLSNILANTDSLLDQSLGDITGLMANLNELTAQLESVSSRLDQMMGNNAEVLESTLTQLNASLARVDTLLISLSSTSESVEGMMAHNQASFYEMMQNLEHASQHFEQFSRSIKERPWNLVRKSTPPERKLP